MALPSTKPVVMEKLPLPVTIGFVRDKAKEGEVVRIGNKIFAKVMCVGLVVSYRFVHTLNSVEYVVSDPSDSGAVKEIPILHHEEPSSSEEQVEYMTGTPVFVSGKLIRFKGSVAIQASCMRKVLSQDEYDCVKMEAFLALQFHTKNPSVQTPVRRSVQNCADPTTVPSPVSAPSSGKRISSTFTPTPKRPNVANSALPSRTVGEPVRHMAADKSPIRHKDDSTFGEGHTGAITAKEVNSQDSFEDTVFLDR